MPPRISVTTAADPELVEEGERIYRGGNSKTGVAACQGCHGPRGSGNPTGRFPALRGQHVAYAAKSLEDFKSGARANDAGLNAGMMRTIAARMSQKEINAVSNYISVLQ